MRRNVALFLSLTIGCAAFQPVLMDSCRGSDGRFVSCSNGSGEGPSAETVLITLAVVAGLGLLSGIIYAATRDPAPPSTPAGDGTVRERQCRYTTGEVASVWAPACPSGSSEISLAEAAAAPAPMPDGIRCVRPGEGPVFVRASICPNGSAPYR